MLIEGEIHAFVSAPGVDTTLALARLKRLQPYYAIPSRFHLSPHLPMTPNGKIDKKSLYESIATPPQSKESKTIVLRRGLAMESQPAGAPSRCATSLEEVDLVKELPKKNLAQPFRGLLLRILIVYRTLFTLTALLNTAVLGVVLANASYPAAATLMTAVNLALCVFMRQDMVINALYTALCSLPKTTPLWIRRRCAKVYHLGGIHSAAGVCATIWLLCDTGLSSFAYLSGTHDRDSLVRVVLSWFLCFVCSSICAVAWPSFRKKHHNTFELSHRLLGWTALLLFWVRALLPSRLDPSVAAGASLAAQHVRRPENWILLSATISIASTWLFLRRVPVQVTPLSRHAVMLTFSYTLPVNGTFTRISSRPLLEWHSFATIPERGRPGYSIIVSGAGDWTKTCIGDPPSSLWVRGLPTCGVMRIATLFDRLVIIATGSGIGPLLGHIRRPTCETQLIWSAPRPRAMFGADVLDTIHRTLPNAVIHDTEISGRPDLATMGYNAAACFKAEAVIIIANEKATKKVVYGLESRGVAAYGAIWDS